MKRLFLHVIFTSLVAVFIVGCAHKFETADLIIHNAVVYTLDETETVTEAIAIKDGKIIETGKERHIMNKYSANEYVDAKGRAVYPGFFDAHCHILNYGKTFLEVDLKNSKSWEETVDKVIAFAKTNKGSWIKGRGWDQNEWAVKEFPTNDLLNKAFPNTPVYLMTPSPVGPATL
jgi:predicted amidohydrolase YtcJ